MSEPFGTVSNLRNVRKFSPNVNTTKGGGSSGVAGGALTGTYPDPELAPTGVTAGTYGSATTVPVVTVNTGGQVTGVVDTPINFPPAPVTDVGFAQTVGTFTGVQPPGFGFIVNAGSVSNGSTCAFSAQWTRTANDKALVICQVSANCGVIAASDLTIQLDMNQVSLLAGAPEFISNNAAMPGVSPDYGNRTLLAFTNLGVANAALTWNSSTEMQVQLQVLGALSAQFNVTFAYISDLP